MLRKTGKEVNNFQSKVPVPPHGSWILRMVLAIIATFVTVGRVLWPILDSRNYLVAIIIGGIATFFLFLLWMEIINGE